MKPRIFYLALICLSTLFLSPVDTIGKPPENTIPLTIDKHTVDSVACHRIGETYYVDIKAIAQYIGGMLIPIEDNVLLIIQRDTTIFILGSPFVKMSDGSVRQLPMPVDRQQDKIFIEAQSLTRLLNRTSKNVLTFDNNQPSFQLTRDQTNSISNDERHRWALDLVVIDAGHGGKDPGAVGPTGLKEKDITLDVAQRLNKYLKSKNIKTVMTRDSDKFVALAERTSIANKSGGKLFISLHCNSAKQRKAQGMETYFLAPSKTERATEVALLENEAIRFEDSRDQYRELTEESYILMTMTQATFTHESELLAGKVQETVAKKAGLKDRGVDQAGFYVLIGASMPSILFEMAFISNKEEEKKLKDKKFRQKIADEIGAVIVNFLIEQEAGIGR